MMLASTPVPEAPTSPAPRRWTLLTVLTCSYGLGAFGMLGVSPLSPALMQGFSLSRLDVGLIVPSIYLGGLLFSVPGGHLADRWGVRPTFLGGLALGGLGLLASALVPGFALYLFCLFCSGAGWSVVNPVLGKAIVDLFPVQERGVAMGIKQMGLTLGGVVAALVLPPIAAVWGWRAAMAACAVGVSFPVFAAWRPLAPLARPPRRHPPAGPRAQGNWWWARRPALLAVFAAGAGLGMVQSAVLAYLPLFSVQALGFTPVGAGMLVAASQAGGAVARLTLGAASDRWGGRRPPWLVFTSALAAVIFLAYAWLPATAALPAALLAFAAGVGAYGWVGIYFIISAEAGGAAHSGLLSGVAFAAIVVGLLAGAPIFGLILEAFDTYAMAWTFFALTAAAIAVLVAAFAGAIHRECLPPRA